MSNPLAFINNIISSKKITYAFPQLSKVGQASRSDFGEDVSYSCRSQLAEEKIKIKSEKRLNHTSSSPLTPNFSLDMTLEDVMKISSVILEKIIEFNQNYKKERNPNSNFANNLCSNYAIFESEELPKVINVFDYILRISSYIKFDKYILILSMMNLDKFLENNKDFTLTRSNCHKLIFLCIMETNKYYDDDIISNKVYSLIGGIEISELLLLEVEFQSKINWKVDIEEQKFYAYSKKLETIFYSSP